MTSLRFAFAPIRGHEVHVALWGDPASPALVLWHGLARTGRDFDELASALSHTFFVMCPDTIGRGLSSWSERPEAEYSIEYYAGVAADLLDYFGIERAGWLGTSMGGLIGMGLASSPLAGRLSYLIVNDVGPEIPAAAVDRILDYAGSQPEFPTLRAAEIWLRRAYQPFGPASDAFWSRMARTSVRRRADGKFTTHYDPKITIQLAASPQKLTVWDQYERIGSPMHVIRGAASDLLTEAVVARMMSTGPRPGCTVIQGCGHAPTLSRPEDARMVHGLIGQLISERARA